MLAGCSTVKVGGGESGPVSGAAVSTGDGEKTASSGSGELHRCSKKLWPSRNRRAANEPADDDAVLPIGDIVILAYATCSSCGDAVRVLHTC